MKKVLCMLSLIVGTLMMSGCDKPQPEGPGNQDGPDGPGGQVVPTADFVLEVSEVTSTSCHFSVQPKDETMSYVVMIVEKSEYDAFEDGYKYQDNDLEWFQRKATEEEKTLEEWLEGFLHKGRFESDEAGLMPGFSYYLYAYGLDYEGYFTTGVTKIEFDTPELVMSDVTFDINVSEIGLTSAKVSVTASEEDALFFFNVFSVEDFNQWGGDDAAFSNHAAALVDYYIQMGQTLDAMVTNLGSIGHDELVFEGLTDNTEYIAYAVGIDENFFVISKPAVSRFTTGKAVKSENTFKVDIQETTFCSVIGTVTPSNDDPFICIVQAKNQFEDYESESDIMYDIVNTYMKWDSLDGILYSGEVVDLESISSLSAETEYEVLCFGWDDAPTTDLTRVPFTTLAAGGRPQNQEFSFVLSDLTHNKVTVNITPKLGLYYFYDCMSVSLFNEYLASEGSEDGALCRFIDEQIDYGAEFFGSSRVEYLEDMGGVIGKQKWTFTDLKEDTEYIIVAASVNMSTGLIAYRKGFKSEVFRTGILIESDAAITFTIDRYYDGTELAELDPSQFSKCRGMVMVPYTVTPNASAVHWRTTFAYGEFLSWAGRDDVLFELDYQCDTDREQGYAVVHYDQVISFLGIAESAEGYTGPFTIYEFQAERGKTSPAQEFIDSLK